MPLSEIVESLRLVTHSAVEAPDKFSMLNRVAFEIRTRAIVLDRQVDYEEAAVADLLCGQDATDFV